MTEFEYTILDKDGIHARPAGVLVETAQKYLSRITIENKGSEVDLRGIFKVMGLAVKYNEKVIIRAEGEDEKEAIEDIKRVLKENL